MQKIVTPNGETLVVIPLADYEALVDAADIAAADHVLAEVAAGREEMIPAEIVDRLLDGENRVRVWREHRGLSARALAEKAGISPAYLSGIEAGAKTGGLGTLRRLADTLSITLDDLVGPTAED